MSFKNEKALKYLSYNAIEIPSINHSEPKHFVVFSFVFPSRLMTFRLHGKIRPRHSLGPSKMIYIYLLETAIINMVGEETGYG